MFTQVDQWTSLTAEILLSLISHTEAGTLRSHEKLNFTAFIVYVCMNDKDAETIIETSSVLVNYKPQADNTYHKQAGTVANHGMESQTIAHIIFQARYI